MEEKGVKNWFCRMLEKIAATAFVRSAIEEQADLSPFKEKPTLAVIAGILLITLSFLLGWPAVALCGAMAVKFDEPLIAVIGGPAVYGFSHLVFLLGMYFSGARYSLIFFRWFSRVTVEKLQSRLCA